jgi:hypothetical protein
MSIIWTEKIKLWNEWHFLKTETQIMQILKMQSISLLLKHTKWAYKGVFLHMFAYANMGHLKAN